MATVRKQSKAKLFAEIVAVILLTALLVGILATEILRATSTLRRETATLATLTETVVTTGYVFRDETVVESVDLGPIDYMAANGDTVAAGDTLAVVYADGAGAGTRARATELMAEIERLQALDASGAVPDYHGAYTNLMYTLSSGVSVAGVAAASDTLRAALDLYAAQGETPEERAARIAALQAEFAELVKNDLGATDTTRAAVGGIFYRETDGFEAVLSTDAVDTLTPGGLRALVASPQDTTLAIGKIVEGGTWYLAVPAERKLADTFAKGAAYDISFDRTGETVRLALDRISAPDTEGEVLLIFRADGLAVPADLGRSQEIVIATATVTGIAVPMTALREEGGVCGVYIEVDGRAAWRTIEPVLLRDGYCFSAVTDTAGCLQAGERILVTPRRIYEGKIL